MREVNSRPVPFELDFEWPQELWGIWKPWSNTWAALAHRRGPYAGKSFVAAFETEEAAQSALRNHAVFAPGEAFVSEMSLEDALEAARRHISIDEFELMGVGLYYVPLRTPWQVFNVR